MTSRAISSKRSASAQGALWERVSEELKSFLVVRVWVCVLNQLFSERKRFNNQNPIITQPHPPPPPHLYTTAAPSINSPDAHVHARADTDAAGAVELAGHGRHALKPSASA